MKTRALCFTLNALALFLPAFVQGARAQEQDVPKFEIGVHFSSLSFNPPNSGGTDTAAGVGGRVAYNFNNYFAVEAEGNLFPSKVRQSYAAGGASQQVLLGAKVGRRWQRFGIFGKARPGAVHFNSVAEVSGYDPVEFGGQTFFFPNVKLTGKTYFSMDVGGVFEFYPSKRILTRFDVGDTLIRYSDRADPFTFATSPPPRLPAELRHSLQVTAGIGFRF